MKKILIVIGLVIPIVGFSASMNFKNCINSENHASVDGCASTENEYQKSRMDAAYNLVLKQENVNTKSIKYQQGKWIKHLEKSCPEISDTGGQFETWQECLAEKTEIRANELENIVSSKKHNITNADNSSFNDNLEKAKAAKSKTVDEIDYLYCFGYMTSVASSIEENLYKFSGKQYILISNLTIPLKNIPQKIFSKHVNEVQKIFNHLKDNNTGSIDMLTIGMIDSFKDLSKGLDVLIEDNNYLNPVQLKLQKCTSYDD